MFGGVEVEATIRATSLPRASPADRPPRLTAARGGRQRLPMTEEMFRVVLETAGAKHDKDGWAALPEGRHMTLHAAHGGVPLTLGKVEAVKNAQGIVWARSVKGDTFVVHLDDLFAAAIDRAP